MSKYRAGQKFIRDFSDKEVSDITENGVIINGQEVPQYLYTLISVANGTARLHNDYTNIEQDVPISFIYQSLKPLSAFRTLNIVKTEDLEGEEFGIHWRLICTDMKHKLWTNTGRHEAIVSYDAGEDYAALRKTALKDFGYILPLEQELLYLDSKSTITDYGDSIRKNTIYIFKYPMPSIDGIIQTSEKELKQANNMTFFEEKDFILGDFSNIDFDFSLFE